MSLFRGYGIDSRSASVYIAANFRPMSRDECAPADQPDGCQRREGMSMNIIEEIERGEMAAVAAKRQIPDFEAGDTVRVHVRVTEGTRTRLQAYEGVVIARKGGGL